jgi:hypothetical protein
MRSTRLTAIASHRIASHRIASVRLYPQAHRPRATAVRCVRRIQLRTCARSPGPETHRASPPTALLSPRPPSAQRIRNGNCALLAALPCRSAARQPQRSRRVRMRLCLSASTFGRGSARLAPRRKWRALVAVIEKKSDSAACSRTPKPTALGGAQDRRGTKALGHPRSTFTGAALTGLCR